ncbi:TM0106 family RecB-like putative nuclease [Bdellovibrionota bacterium FG-2]
MRKTKTSGILHFSPSDLTTYLESPFSSWMDRFALEFPGEIESDEEDEAAELIQTKGMDHEKKVLEALKKEFKDVSTIEAEGNFESRHAATLTAMQKGASVIYQAALKRDSFLGYADFLVKVPGHSKLGDFHYEAWDSKLARSTKPYFVIQLLAYSEMLESVQGMFPQSITVVLGTGERKTLRSNDFASYYASLKKRFLEFHSGFDRNQRPRIQKNEEIRNWSEYAAKLIIETDDLSQVANIRSSQQRKLERAGISTLTALAGTKLKQIPDLEAATLAKLKRQARLQLESRGFKKPKYEILDHPQDQRTGLRLLPPPSSGDVYFDMEGYPLFEDQGLEYLFGAIHLDDKKDQKFIDFWAHNRTNEKKAFEGWIDWVYARFKGDPAMHIYHYAAYEVTAMRKLSTQHATSSSQTSKNASGPGMLGRWLSQDKSEKANHFVIHAG